MRLTVSTAILNFFIPLTEKLITLNRGYKEQKKKKKRISHLIYMDDLKLIAKSEEELRKQVQAVKNLAMIFVWNVD